MDTLLPSTVPFIFIPLVSISVPFTFLKRFHRGSPSIFRNNDGSLYSSILLFFSLLLLSLIQPPPPLREEGARRRGVEQLFSLGAYIVSKLNHPLTFIFTKKKKCLLWSSLSYLSMQNPCGISKI